MKVAASEDSSSAIRQAYLAALQQELSSLYQLMAQLDALAGHPLPAGTAHRKLPIMLRDSLPGTCHLQTLNVSFCHSGQPLPVGTKLFRTRAVLDDFQTPALHA